MTITPVHMIDGMSVACDDSDAEAWALFDPEGEWSGDYPTREAAQRAAGI